MYIKQIKNLKYYKHRYRVKTNINRIQTDIKRDQLATPRLPFDANGDGRYLKTKC